MSWPRPSIGRATLIVTGLAQGLGASTLAHAETDPLRIAAFGTSLTANGGWQSPLASALEACIQRPVAVADRGQAGAASDWGVEAADGVAATRPDVVLLEFAANDSAVDRWIGVASSTANMRRIIQTFRDRKPDVVIYVMTMNPFSGLRSWARPWRHRYEDAHRELAGELKVGYIDHRPTWAAMTPDELYLKVADGVHPSPAAAASVIVPAVVTRLARDGVIRCAGG